MTEAEKKEITKMVLDGADEDAIERYCVKNGISVRLAFRMMAAMAAPKCCEGCRHVGMYPSMAPCTNCSRTKKDMYERDSGEKV